MKKPKILCICRMGENRSKYLAGYLKRKGYSTRFGGIGHGRRDFVAHNPFDQKDVDWADVLILIRPKLLPILKAEFNVKCKKIIVIDVTDSRRLVSEKFPEFEGMDFVEFQKKWTRPELRKAIAKYLPLEN